MAVRGVLVIYKKYSCQSTKFLVENQAFWQILTQVLNEIRRSPGAISEFQFLKVT
jgi:hypothetical protein